MSEERNPAQTDKRSGIGAYLIAALSFVPLVGLLFGAITIIWGLLVSKSDGKRLAAIGLAGISFTCIIYGALYYFGEVQRGGVFDDLRTQFTRRNLDSLVPVIEYYKLQRGEYPASLEDLEASLPSQASLLIYDSSRVNDGPTLRRFFYERVGTDHYYLRSTGPDRVPFSSDDIVPSLTQSEAAKTGLLLERKADASTP